jgi:hypothetical protein
MNTHVVALGRHIQLPFGSSVRCAIFSVIFMVSLTLAFHDTGQSHANSGCGTASPPTRFNCLFHSRPCYLTTYTDLYASWHGCMLLSILRGDLIIRKTYWRASLPLGSLSLGRSSAQPWILQPVAMHLFVDRCVFKTVLVRNLIPLGL